MFTAEGGGVGATARFDGGRIHVDEEPAQDWTVRVRFANANALRSFLFSKDQDILNSVLRNEVEVDGNINYIYKFGFMARQLERRLGLQA